LSKSSEQARLNGCSNKNLNERIKTFLTEGYDHCLNELNYNYFLIYIFFHFPLARCALFPINPHQLLEQNYLKNLWEKGAPRKGKMEKRIACELTLVLSQLCK
jgi:hypothetical protein